MDENFMRLIQGMRDNTENDDGQRPEPLAQAMELRERFARMQKTANFRPGDIVRGKRAISMVKDDMRVVFILIRPLTGSAYDDLLRADVVKTQPIAYAGFEPDWLAADCFRMGGAGLSAMLLPSNLFEHVSDEELAAWELPKDED